MAANALEEKINKIRQQNEEIRRRHEEVEEDKKNAAKLNALVQMVPSTDWPERKEPPEFSNPPRTNNKTKPAKEHHEHPQQYHSASGEGRKVHTFAQGQGPPPDPKYNFLADAEREEEGNMDSTKDSPPNRREGQKHVKGIFRRKSGGKDGMQKDYRMNRGHRRDEHQPEYEAWRAERNRIDEDRISRQRTAEGNWRREWDNDKAHIVDEVTRSEGKLGDYVKKDHKDFDRRHHVNGNDYASHNRTGGYRSYRGNSRHFHNNYENRSNNAYHQEGHVKNSMSSGSEERTVVATDKSLKVMLNQEKGPVMSVKVNSPSIAGTGRVGPRQRSRITYSSHSDVEAVSHDTELFSRPKSYEDKPKGIYHDNQKFSNSRKTQSSKKKDFSNKSPHFRKKEIGRDSYLWFSTSANENPQKHHEMESTPKEHKESQKFYQSKFQKLEATAMLESDKIETTELNVNENNVIFSGELDANNTEVQNKDNQNDNLTSYIDEENKIYANMEEGELTYTDEENKIYATMEEGEFTLQDSDLTVSKDELEIEICKINEEMENKSDEKMEDKLDEKMENKLDEKMENKLDEKMENKSDKGQIAQTAVVSEITETDLTVSLAKNINDNDEDKIKYMTNLSCDASDDINETVIKNKEDNSPMEQTEILNDNCDNNQTEDMNKQENFIKPDVEGSEEKKEPDSLILSPSNDISSIMEQNNKMDSDTSLEEREVATVEDKVVVIDDKINISNKQNVIKSTDETQECKDENNENESVAKNSIVDDTAESLKEDLQVKKEEEEEKEEVKAALKVVKTEE